MVSGLRRRVIRQTSEVNDIEFTVKKKNRLHKNLEVIKSTKTESKTF